MKLYNIALHIVVSATYSSVAVHAYAVGEAAFIWIPPIVLCAAYFQLAYAKIGRD